MSARNRGVIGAVVAVLLLLYFRGTFDTALYPLGLNFQTCGKNGFGAVFCGDDLEAYEKEVVQPARRAGRKLEEIGQRAREVGREAECIAYPRRCYGY